VTEAGWLERTPKYDRAFDALEGGDLDAFMEVMSEEVDPEVEFRSGIGTVVGGGTYTGVEGIREWFSDFLSISRTRRWAERRYEAFGDDVGVFFARLEFTGATSEVPVSSETGVVLHFRDGRIVRIDSFTSHSEARELAEAQRA
jgi:ketosteroid isomerase-like protein